MQFSAIFLFAASAAAIAKFEWDCTKSLGTCNNACYAVDHGLAKAQLTYDSDDSKRNPRRTASGCNKTPCSNTKYKKYGDSCDEYPFASVKEGGKGAILRCVDSTENSSEGGQLGNFYKTIKNGDKFEIVVRNYKGATFCTSSGAKNDGSEFKLSGSSFKDAKVRRAGLGFVDAEPRSEPQGLREFVDENGEKLLILNTDKNITHVGTSIYSGDKWVKIVAEIF